MNKTEQNKQVVFGWTHEQLTEAFNEVRNANDWKAPIARLVPQDKLAVTLAAIEFFTATKPRIGSRLSEDLVWVTADGYRKGPAGP